MKWFVHSNELNKVFCFSPYSNHLNRQANYFITSHYLDDHKCVWKKNLCHTSVLLERYNFLLRF
jgi:hypothetical protein